MTTHTPPPLPDAMRRPLYPVPPHPEHDEPTTNGHRDDQPDPVEVFWDARPELAAIRQHARARRASPLAVLGVTLTRVVCSVGPAVVLPPIVGGPVSLNLFAALVGPSGAGKDAALAAARDALDLDTPGACPFVSLGLGSGEGIAHSYVRTRRGNADHDEPARVVEQHTTSVLFTVAEVDTLAALGDRRGATLLPELRRAWTGDALGFAYADPEKRLPVAPHTYRMGVVVGVQPSRAAALLNDRDGGTPQRFVWLPATDPDAPDTAPDTGPGIAWNAPTLPPVDRHGLRVLPVCPTAWHTIDTARLERLRGTGDALDGHALLARLKVAAALALLHGRAEVREDDWDLGGVVMRASDRVRAQVVEQLARDAAENNRRRGEAEGERAAVAAEVVDREAARRVAGRIVRHLSAAGGRASHSELRRKCAARDRGYFDAATDALLTAGRIVAEAADQHGQTSRHYLLSEVDQ